MVYLELFLSFFKIGLFSVGGGYAAMPLIQAQVVDTHRWLSLTEFTDLITISEMTPGPIAINAATFVGTQVAGLAGAITATLGCVLPSCAIVLTLAMLYSRFRGAGMIEGVLSSLRPAVVAMIASAALTMLVLVLWGAGGVATGLSLIHWPALVLFILALIALRKFKLSPILVMMLCGLVGGILYFI